MSSSATGTAQAVAKSAVTLKGSAKLVSEFFHYGVNSILYQRGIYPSGKDNVGKEGRNEVALSGL